MGKMNSIVPGFNEMPESSQLKTILCPKSTAAVKVVNKFIRIMFLARDKISEGLSLNEYPTMPVNIYPFNSDFNDFSYYDEWEQGFTEICLSEYENDSFMMKIIFVFFSLGCP